MNDTIKSSDFLISTQTTLSDDEAYWGRNSVNGYLYPKTLTDKVGIGTNLPTEELEVYGDSDTTIKVTSTTDNNPHIKFSTNDITKVVFGYYKDWNALVFDHSESGATINSASVIIQESNMGLSTIPTSFKLQSDGHVGPNQDLTFDLGSPILRWRNLYANNIYVGDTPLALELTRNVPTVTNDYVELGYFFIGNGTHNLRISITINEPGFYVSKQYFIPARIDCTAGVWNEVIPLYDTGQYTTNDVGLDLNGDDYYLYLRLRRTSGTLSATANIRIESLYSDDNFTETTATGSGSISGYYNNIINDISNDYVGINTINPSLVFDVRGKSTLTQVAQFTNSDWVDSTTGSALLLGHGSATGDTYSLINAYISGSSTIGDLVLQNEGGWVGIGTNSPGAVLNIADTNTGGGHLWLSCTSADISDGTGIDFRHDSDNKLQAYIRDEIVNGSWGTKLHFGTSSASNSALVRMSIDQNGYVGIGTPSPTEKLEVRDGYVRIKSTGTTDYGLKLVNDVNTNYIIGVTDSLDSAPQRMFIQTNAGKSVYITASGLFGIGADPSTNFMVYGASASSWTSMIRSQSPTINNGISLFNNSLSYNGNAFTTGSADDLDNGDLINSDFVGGMFVGNTTYGGLILAGTSNGDGITAINLEANQAIESSTTRAAIWLNAVVESVNDRATMANDSKLFVIANNSTPIVTVLGNGDTTINGGLSTTTSSYFLGTKDSITIPTASSITIDDTPSAALGVGGGIIFQGAYTGSTKTTAGAIHAYKSTATDSEYGFDLAFNTRVHGGNNTEKMRITTDGKVGIGGTPLQKLTVRSSTAGTAVYSQIYHSDNTNTSSHAIFNAKVAGTSGGDPATCYEVTGGFTWCAGVDNSDSDKFKVSRNSVLGTNDFFTIDGSGQTGINQATPTAQLDINGTLKSNNTVTFTGLGTGTDNTVVILNSSNQLTTDEIDSRVWGNTLVDYSSSSANYIPKFSDADTITNSVLYEDSGKIGLGVTTALGQLHVEGSYEYSTLYVKGTSTNNATGMIIASDNTKRGFMYVFNSTHAYTNDTGLGSEHGKLRFYANNTNYMTVTTTGQVGIGTDTPGTYYTVAAGLEVSRTVGLINVNSSTGNNNAYTFSVNGSVGWGWAENGSNFRMMLLNASAAEKLSILQGGDVGIGNTAPVRSLDVLRSAAVSSIRVEGDNAILEIRDQSSNNAWSLENDGANLLFQYDAALADATYPTTDKLKIDTSGNIGLLAGTYINWDLTTIGSSGYGFRDNSGIIECKQTGEDWVPVGYPGVLDVQFFSFDRRSV